MKIALVAAAFLAMLAMIPLIDAAVPYCVQSNGAIIAEDVAEQYSGYTGRVCTSLSENSGYMKHRCSVGDPDYCPPGFTCYAAYGSCQKKIDDNNAECRGIYGQNIHLTLVNNLNPADSRNVLQVCETYSGQPTGNWCQAQLSFIGSIYRIANVAMSSYCTYCGCPSGSTCTDIGGGTARCVPDACTDADSDEYGKPATPACANPQLDCNDGNANIHPGAFDAMGNSIDENCDGGDSICNPGSTQSCTNTISGQVCGGTKTCDADGNSWGACIDTPGDNCPCTDSWESCSAWTACTTVGETSSRTCSYTGTCSPPKAPVTETRQCNGAFSDRVLLATAEEKFDDAYLATTYGEYNDLNLPLDVASPARLPGVPAETIYFSYFPNGNLEKLTLPSTGGFLHEITYAYDPDLLAVSRITDERGGITQYSYDNFGRLYKVLKPGSTNWNNPNAEYAYLIDKAQDEKVTEKVLVDATNGKRSWTETYSDVHGRAYKTILKDKDDSSKDVKKQTDFDSAGRPYRAYKPVRNSQPFGTYTQNAYLADPLGRLDLVTLPGAASTLQYSYGVENGRLYARLRDENNIWKASYLDEWGNEIEVREGSTDGVNFPNSNTFAYDLRDNLLGVTDAEMHSSTYLYDDLNRPIESSHPDLGAIGHKYDDLGNVIEKGGGPNLLKDGGFESGSLKWGGQPDAQVIETSNCRGGGKCAKAVYANWAFSQVVTFLPGTDYVLSFWLKNGAGFAPGTTMARVLLDSGGTTLIDSTYHSGKCNTVLAGGDWRKVICHFSTQSFSSGRLYVVSGGGDTPDLSKYLLVDDVKLALQAKLNLLKNPGFESGSEDWGEQNFTSESGTAHSGKKSFRSVYGNWWANENLKLEADADYVFSVWQKMSGNTPAATRVMIETASKYPDPSGNWITYMDSYLGSDCATTATEGEWQQRTCTFSPADIIRTLPSPLGTPFTSPDDPRLNVNIYVFSGTDCSSPKTWEQCKAEYNFVDDISLAGGNTKYEYDGLGRIIKVKYPGAWGEANYAYDSCASGKLCTITEPAILTSYSYDFRGRIATSTKVMDGRSYTTTYAYADSDQPRTVTYPENGANTRYYYNNFGGIEAVEDGSRLATFLYNPTSSLDQVKFGPNAASPVITTQYQYYDREWLKSISTGSLYQRAFKYDSAGNLQLSRQGTDPNGGAYLNAYTYDNLGRLDAVPLSETGKTYDYSYDKAGNRLAEVRANSPVSSIAFKYEYQLTAGSHSQKLRELHVVSSDGTPYTNTLKYDPFGNLVQKECAFPADCISSYLEYTPENQLRKAVTAAGRELYTYDYTGMRMRKETRTGLGSTRAITHYIYDLSGNLIYEKEFTAPSSSKSNCVYDKKTGQYNCKAS